MKKQKAGIQQASWYQIVSIIKFGAVVVTDFARLLLRTANMQIQMKFLPCLFKMRLCV